MSLAQTSASNLVQDVNEAQRQASAPEQSVWVSASAGSGKTKVLADRVTRLLLSGVPPQRILCLTFTRAAAAEMAIRLTQRLSNWTICVDDVLQDALTKLQNAAPTSEQMDQARRLFAQVLACPGGMRVQTIHAFAQEVLRRFPLEAGLPPHFTVLDESESSVLWQDAFQELLEQLAEGQNAALTAAFAKILASLGEGTLLSLFKEARGREAALRRAVQKAGGIEKLTRAVFQKLDLMPDETPEDLVRAAVREGAFDRAELHRAALLIQEKGSKTYQAHAEKVLAWLSLEEEADRADGFMAYQSAFLTKDAERNIRKTFLNNKVAEENPWVDDIFRAEGFRLRSVFERLQTLEFAQLTAALLPLAFGMMQAFAAKKQERAALDYDDLIAFTVRVLSRDGIAPWVLYKLDGGIDHILVDESQDTNPDQWRIIKALADEYFTGESGRPRTLFVVGDEKQSIYSFLKADPEEFARMHAHFSTLIDGAEKPFREVPLNVSFRSAPAILKAVDAVFTPPEMQKGVSLAPVAHSAFRAQAAGRVELWPLCLSPEEEGKGKKIKDPCDWLLPLGYETEQKAEAMLAAQLAQDIKRWVERGDTIYDSDLKLQRPMRYGDIMLLVQERGSFVEYFVRAMKWYHVPVSGVDRMRLTEQLAVMDLMALLQLALLPEDDLTLAVVLRGPLLNVSEDRLMTLAISRGPQQGLFARMAEDASFETEKEYLDKIAGLADVLTPLALLQRILSEACPADAISGRRALARRLGPDAEDPIDEFLSEAESFSQRNTPSLQSFLHWLLSSDFQIKREMEPALDRVRILTVHGSKGLEAPVVILPDTMRVPSRAKIDKILWDEASLLPFYVPRMPLSGALRALREKAYQEKSEEHRRLLYVAMTRAADRLYICGFGKEKKKKDKDEKEETPSENTGQSWYDAMARALLPLDQEQVQRDPKASVPARAIVADIAALSLPPATQTPSIKNMEPSLPPPAWLHQPPPPEPSPPRPLIPSRPEEEDPPLAAPNDPRFRRGRIMHRLLQSLPDVREERRQLVAQRFLASAAHQLSPQTQKEMAEEVLGLLADPRFAPLFGPDSRAEIPVVGLSATRRISGQIDRLVQKGDEVWIVDFKTNRPPPATAPAVYQSQMNAYRTVLEAIYAGKKVRCFLLWTYTLQMMEI